jgi:hypothetical protein
MKIQHKLALTFSGLITAAYPAWLAHRKRKPVRDVNTARPVVLRAFYFFRERMAGVNLTKVLVERIKIGLAIAMLTALTGCVGFVDGGGGDGGGGWRGGPVFVGGGYDRGHDVRSYSARGAESRGVAHGGGGHATGGGGHEGGGGGGKR